MAFSIFSLKRAIEFSAALIIIFILLPVFILISGIILIETLQLPVLKQKRGVTLEKNHFRIYKFRTLKNIEIKNLSVQNIFVKSYLQGSVTFSGRFLRRTGLDEIPQLFNILKGEMSFIGPRPLTLEDLEQIKINYPDYYSKRSKLTSKPGITGYWQVFGDRNKGIENLLYSDIYYENNNTTELNFKIFVSTLRIVLLGMHNDSIFPDNFWNKRKYPLLKFQK